MLSIRQLMTPQTRPEVLALITRLLTLFGFDTTGWQDGRIQKTLLVTFATIVSDFTEVAATIAAAGFNDFASGDLLTEFSRSRFGHERLPAVKARRAIQLVSRSTSSYVIKPGEVIAKTDDGAEFVLVSIVAGDDVNVLRAGGVGSCLFEARSAGAKSNVPASAITRLSTSMAGVTLEPGGNLLDQEVTGRDEETDAALRRRNATRWSNLGAEPVPETYEYIARNAGASKVVVHDQNPRGPGTIDVFVASDAGPLETDDMVKIQREYSRRTFWTSPVWPAEMVTIRPMGGTPYLQESKVSVQHPRELAIDLKATLYHDRQIDGTTVIAAAKQALADLLARTPIGGQTYAGGVQNILSLGDIFDALESIENVQTVTIDSLMGATELANVQLSAISLAVAGNVVFTTQASEVAA